MGQPFNDNTGGGITLGNMFTAWPKESLFVACYFYLFSSSTDFSRCQEYYCFGYQEYRWRFPFNLFQRKHRSGVFKRSKTGSSQLKQYNKSWQQRFKERKLLPFLKYFGFHNAVINTAVSPDLIEWVHSIRPDIIYAQGTSRADLKFITELKKLLHLPLVVHVMDDWFKASSGSGVFSAFWYPRIQADFKRLLSVTDMFLCISDKMAFEYLARYGKESAVIQNGVDLGFWGSKQKVNYELSPEPVILYAGRIGLGIEDSLIALARVLDQINLTRDISIKFLIHAPVCPSPLLDFKCVDYRLPVSFEELPGLFGSADILYLPYDFSSSSVDYIRLSMPTKAPEFMISGTPVLIYAPDDIALVEFAREFDWAHIVSKEDELSLKNGINELLDDANLRARLGKTARQVAAEKFDKHKVGSTFCSYLRQLSPL